MKAYAAVSGGVFALVFIAHAVRVALEGSRVLNAVFVISTLIAGSMAVWAWRLWRASGR